LNDSATYRRLKTSLRGALLVFGKSAWEAGISKSLPNHVCELPAIEKITGEITLTGLIIPHLFSRLSFWGFLP
jgi:hypothetical protein